MARYHINSKGEPGVCRANKSCPFGGSDDHYSTAEEAREIFEVKASLYKARVEKTQKVFTEEETILTSISDEYDTLRKSILDGSFKENLDAQDQEELEEIKKIDAKLGNYFPQEMTNDELSMAIDSLNKNRLFEQEDLFRREWARREKLANGMNEGYDKLQELEDAYQVQTARVRNAWYDREISWKEAADQDLVNPDDKPDSRTAEAKKSNRRYMKTMDMETHFDNMPLHYRQSASEELAAWSNMTVKEAEDKIDNYDAYAEEEKSNGREPLSKDDYVVRLFQENMDEDRLVASIDLETTGFHPTSAEIIEIGIVVKDRKGNLVKRIDERFDVERDDVRDTLGVGPSDIHKIYPKDIKGKPKFSDPEVQARIGKILNDPNVVMLAHNANFEKSFLNHNLSGFQKARDHHGAANLRKGQAAAPTQDTRALSAFLLHSTSNNKLESFTQANGIPYVDSHSALPDAQMTVDALEKFRENLKSAPEGKRPNLTYEGMPPFKEKKRK